MPPGGSGACWKETGAHDAAIKTISCRRILNSHVEFTNEFIVELADGAVGIGGSPQGETISIYEDKRIGIGPETIIRKLKEAGVIGREIDQEGFDAVLEKEIPHIGRNNAFSLSLAFFNAARETGPSTSYSACRRPSSPRPFYA